MPNLTPADVADMCRDEKAAVEQRGFHFLGYLTEWAKVTREANEWQRAADVVEQLAEKLRASEAKLAAAQKHWSVITRGPQGIAYRMSPMARILETDAAEFLNTKEIEQCPF